MAAENVDINVPTGAIRAHASGVDDVASTVEEARRRGAASSLSAAAFGPLSQSVPPRLDASRRLAVDTMVTAIATVRGSAGGLRTEATRFTVADAGGVADVAALTRSIDSGPRDLTG